jgi:hypothetical protein
MIYGWTKEVGADLGLTDRTIRNDLMLYRGLPASLVERLRAGRHPILANASQLRALAKLEPATRERVVDALLGAVVNGRTITSVSVALAHIGTGRAAPDPEAKRLSAFIGAFSRMSLAEKKGALAQLAGMLPAGSRLVGQDELSDRADLRAALNTAFDFFLKLDAWDPDAAIAMIADDARKARQAVQLACMSANADVRRSA